MRKIALITMLAVSCLFAQSFNGGVNGNMNQTGVSSKNGNAHISQVPGMQKSSVIVIETEGIGVNPPSAISRAQSMAMARRSAIIDAYKALTEKLYGIKINGREKVRNMVLQDSKFRSKIAGLIRGATIEGEDYRGGIYKVVMSLKLNVKNWNNYLQAVHPYSGAY